MSKLSHKYQALSKDYKRLYKLAKTQTIVCFTNYSFRECPGEFCRDVCGTLCNEYKGDFDVQLSARGICYMSGRNEEEFIRRCKKCNVEFIDPDDYDGDIWCDDATTIPSEVVDIVIDDDCSVSAAYNKYIEQIKNKPTD